MSFVLLGILNSQAAGGAAAEPAFFHESTTNIGSFVETITLSSLPTEYKHLQIRFMGHADTNNENAINTGMRFSTNPSGTLYWIGWEGDLNSLDPVNSSGSEIPFKQMGGAAAAAQSNAVITILDYNATDKKQQATIQYSASADAFGGQRGGYIIGASSQTGPVTNITFSGNKFRNTRVSVYGIKG